MIFPCITLTGKDGGSEGEGEDDEDEAEDMEDADDEGEGGEGSDDEGGSDNSEAGDEESAQQDKRGGSGGKGDKAKPEACKGGRATFTLLAAQTGATDRNGRPPSSQRNLSPRMRRR